MQKLEGVKIASLSGLLSEAGLVWLSVDNVLYLWSYEGGDDFCSFDKTHGQCIVSVGIVKPKKGKLEILMGEKEIFVCVNDCWFLIYFCSIVMVVICLYFCQIYSKKWLNGASS